MQGMVPAARQAAVKKPISTNTTRIVRESLSPVSYTHLLSAPVADDVLKKAVEDQDYKVLSIQ